MRAGPAIPFSWRSRELDQKRNETMIAVPMPLPANGTTPHALHDLLTKRLWATRQAPAYVMTADCAGRPGQLPQPAGALNRVSLQRRPADNVSSRASR